MLNFDECQLTESIHGKNISVLNTKLGDFLESIPISLLIRTNVSIADEKSLKEQIDKVKKHDGWLESKNVSWHFKNEMIMHIRLCEPVECINCEADIERILGKADHIILSFGNLEYLYTSRDLKICWSNNQKKLNSIVLGNCNISENEKKETLLKGNVYVAGIQKVCLQRLKQYRVYEGLLMGLPTQKMNSSTLEHILHEAQKKYDCNCYLIDPVRIEIKDENNYPFGKPELLPSIVCIGLFQCRSTTKDFEKDYSELVIIWLQDKFALPIDANILTEMEKINWRKEATDFAY